MITISEHTHPELYYDLPEKCLGFCNEIQNCEMGTHVDYHIFWNVGLEFSRKQMMTIKSYLCTQNLQKTRLHLWSNVDLTNLDILKPYLNYIEFKIWNPELEIIGTPLECRKNDIWKNDKYNWIRGDMFRILTLYKYGGLYVDMDVVFLRDFSPLLNQEFMYKWSFQQDMINGAVMRLFKDSALSKDLIETMCDINPIEESTSWSTQLYQKVREKNKNWTIFPATFFNTEWQINIYKFADKFEDYDEMRNFIMYPMKKTRYSHEFYDGAFSWHWHNNWETEIEQGSKWQLLEEKFDNEIYKKFGIK